mgnify:CR=1 FL=1
MGLQSLVEELTCQDSKRFFNIRKGTILPFSFLWDARRASILDYWLFVSSRQRKSPSGWLQPIIENVSQRLRDQEINVSLNTNSILRESLHLKIRIFLRTIYF